MEKHNDKDKEEYIELQAEPVRCGICNKHVPVFRFYPPGVDIELPGKFVCEKCINKDCIITKKEFPNIA